MASQIPEGAEGTVAGVMVYCSICLIASSLMIWLTWTHQERTSYVAMISYFTALSIVASLVQQTHDLVRYEDVLKEQFQNTKLHPGNPEIAIANGSVGVDLVLYYIQYYCYNVEAMCVMFWAGYLAQSSGARSKWKKILNRVNRAGKVFSVVFPLTTILMLRIPQVQQNFILFILLADLPLMLSLFFGCILMLTIFTRYVRSKRKFLHWSEEGGTSGTYGTGTGTGTGVDSRLESGSMAKSGSSSVAAPLRKKRPGIWDRWLMLRFTIGFVALSIFEVTNTLFQIMAVTNAAADLASTEPDLSVERARATWIFFMPGVTPGLFIFIIFGTTTPLRRYMRETLVKLFCWRRRRGGGSGFQGDEEGQRVVGGIRTATASRPEHVRPPPPPPKDTGHYAEETELPVFARHGTMRSGRMIQSNNASAAADVGRSDSDEWPMLPIMKHDQR